MHTKKNAPKRDPKNQRLSRKDCAILPETAAGSSNKVKIDPDHKIKKHRSDTYNKQ